MPLKQVNAKNVIFVAKVSRDMGNWSEQQEAKKEIKERDKARKENLAKYFFNLSQLVFAGLFIGGLLSFFQGTLTWQIGIMIAFGIIATVSLARIGNNILK